MPKLSRTQETVKFSEVGHAMASFEVDTRLAISGETEWHHVGLADFAAGLHCYPLWNRAFVYPAALELLTNAPSTNDALKFLGRNRAVVVPKGFAKDRAWLVEQGDWLREQGPVSPYDYLLQLAHKRCFGRVLFRSFEKNHKRIPTANDLIGAIQKFQFGDRRILRAEVDTDLSGMGTIDWRDEFLLAACHDAIMDGHDAVIVTTDKTVVEQFITLVCRLERDYRASMLAEATFAELQSPQFSPLEECKNLGFLSDLYIRTMSASEVNARMPEKPWPVQLHCWLIDIDETGVNLLPISFRAERPMHTLFTTRNKNEGRNACLPGGINAHFSWEQHVDSMVGKVSFALGSQLTVGGDDFPLNLDMEDRRQIWTYEIVDIQNLCDPIQLPWHIS